MDGDTLATNSTVTASAGPSGGWRSKRLFNFTVYAFGLSLLSGLIIKTEPGNIWMALAKCHWGYLLLGTGLFALNLFWRSGKWFYLLRGVQPDCRLGPVVKCYVTTMFFSNLTPGKSGEALAPLLLETHCQTPKTTGFAVVFVDRTLEFMALLVALLWAALYLSVRADQLSSIRLAALIGASVIAVGIVLLIILLKITRSGLSAQEQQSSVFTTEVAGFKGKVRRVMWTFRAALSQVGQRSRLSTAGVMTLFAWGLDFLIKYMIICAFMQMSIVDSIACQIIAIAAALLSLVPGGIGISAVSFLLVAKTMGYPWEPIASAGVVTVFLTHGVRLVLASGSDIFLRGKSR